MSPHHINGRLAKLEAQSAPPARAAGTLYVWRLPHESDAEALDIWDQAYGRALDDWTNLLWQAPWPQTKEETS